MTGLYRDYLSQLIPTIRMSENEPLSKYTSFRIGGAAPLMIFPDGQQQTIAALRAAKICGTQARVLGGGSNVLASDEGVDFAVVKLSGGTMRRLDGARIEAEAGCGKAAFAAYAAGQSLSGAEFMHGIPGAIGGGIVMNAGAYGGEMAQLIESVTACDRDGVIHRLNREKCGFGYRHSFFSEDPKYTILSAVMKLTPGEKADINARMTELAARRREKQPLEYPSAGSTFKRPAGYFAGQLIEEAGLKGCAIGGAQVSEKHAGFIINHGGASCDDVKRLIEYVKETVLRRCGVELECEVELW